MRPREIRLSSVSFECVEFRVITGRDERLASVIVAADTDWFRATTFPHVRDESGESTGDATLDQQIRVRAAEELTRLAAAAEATKGWAEA